MQKKYYVPILKWKRGEQIAVEHLDDADKDKLLPLIEIPPIEFDYSKKKPKKTIDQQVTNIANSIHSSFGERNVFLDLFKLYAEGVLSSGKHPIEYIVNESLALNISIVPVVKSNSEQRYVQAVQSLLMNNVINEICIRIEECDFQNINDTINNILNIYNVKSNQCHIVIDLKEKAMNSSATYGMVVSQIVNKLNNLNNWVTITLTVTSFPKNLEQVKKNSHSLLPRIEFGLWQNINNSLSSRKIQFGDYCISNPEYSEFDLRFIQMSGNIRYTIDNSYLVYKGVSTKTNGFGQMIDMCKSLMNTTYYLGQNFSWGDSYIHGVTNMIEGTGNAETWRRVGTNHHIKLVINQLSNVAYF